MEIIKLSQMQNKANEGFVVALGKFDGLHLGHMQLIEKAKKLAIENSLKSAVFTFEAFKGPSIFDEKTKMELLENAGIDRAYVASFEDLRNMSPVDFSKYLVEFLGAKIAVCGYNFRFGKNAQGEASDLKRLCTELGTSVSVVACYKKENVAVSSTLIRSLLGEGKVEEAALYLGRNFKVEGKVTHGRKIGRIIGYPTANINMPKDIAPLKNGVYFTYVCYGGKKYPAITNVGLRPTFSVGELNVESHIIVDFNESLYEKNIAVEFCKFSRDEIKFREISQLQTTLASDKSQALEYFGLK